MVETITNARKHLTGHVARFRDQGVDAEPVIFGDHRRPEAALLPYDTFQLLLDIAEDVVIAERIRQRTEADTGNRTTLSAAAAEFGIDLEEL